MATTRAVTIADLLPDVTGRFLGKAALSIKSQGLRSDLTYAELAEIVGEVGLGLMKLGLQRGDHVAILCDTRPEWTYAQLAVTSAGGVVVPVYPSSSATECQWVLENSEAKMLICENASQLAKITAVRDGLPGLERLIVIDPVPERSDAITWAQLRRAADVQQLWSIAASVRPEDIFAIVYTSGTTGKPKGCVLSHRNVRAVVDAMAELDTIRPGESTYLFLPLAHVFSLILQLLCLNVGGRLALWGGDATQIFEEIQDVEPAYFPAVPRIFEKIYARFAPVLRDKLGEQGFAELVAIGAQVRAEHHAGREVDPERLEWWKAADENVFAEVRRAFGGKIRQAATGAAPIAREVLEFFHAAGIPVLEGYGMTETSTAITVSTPQHWKFGTVGRPLPHLEVRLAEDDEILVKGANVFEGYYKDEKATAEVIVDGWLHTGDLGSFDEEGFLSITGRKKDLIITAGGKNIAPSRIENDVMLCPFISHAVLHGDRRPYPVMLIALDREAIGEWAIDHGKDDDLSQLVEDPNVIALVQAAVDDANDKHARAAQAKAFFLLDRELSASEGELTPTMKLKRKVVNERFAAQFDRLYERR
jgi:long-chain acyl-CoA synthetase